MSFPLAHSPTLPGDRPTKERVSCGTCDKTFANIKTRHAHLMKCSHELKDTLEVTVPFFLNLQQQTIKCPVCTFKSRKVKSPQGFITHFSRHATNYTLKIAYTCLFCMEVMNSNDVNQHFEMHCQNRLPLTASTHPSNQDTPVPVPTSPSTADTLSTSSTSSPCIVPSTIHATTNFSRLIGLPILT